MTETGITMVELEEIVQMQLGHRHFLIISEHGRVTIKVNKIDLNKIKKMNIPRKPLGVIFSYSEMI